MFKPLSLVRLGREHKWSSALELPPSARRAKRAGTDRDDGHTSPEVKQHQDAERASGGHLIIRTSTLLPAPSLSE
jgi:hypothetical protein